MHLTTTDVYSVTTESVSDKPLAKLLEELLIEMIETESPHLCADRTSSL